MKSFSKKIFIQRPIAWGQPRICTIQKGSHEEHGFFLAIDRDRGGQVLRRIERGGPADRAGLRKFLTEMIKTTGYLKII